MKALFCFSRASFIKYSWIFYIQKQHCTSAFSHGVTHQRVGVVCYPCYVLDSIPLRVIEVDFFCNDVGGHQTPVNIEVDRHQQQSLGEQIYLDKDGRKQGHIGLQLKLKPTTQKSDFYVEK